MSELETTKNKYVTFQSGDEYYGLKIGCVNEIIVYQEITAMPETADYIKGLINLRGKIIPVVDVRLRFKQEPIPYTDRTCIIVVAVGSNVVGLIVEKIAEVVEITEDNILPPPSITKNDKNSRNKFISGIGKVGEDVKLLLDPARLLKDDDEGLHERVEALEDSEEEEHEEV